MPKHAQTIVVVGGAIASAILGAAFKEALEALKASEDVLKRLEQRRQETVESIERVENDIVKTQQTKDQLGPGSAAAIRLEVQLNRLEEVLEPRLASLEEQIAAEQRARLVANVPSIEELTATI